MLPLKCLFLLCFFAGELSTLADYPNSYDAFLNFGSGKKTKLSRDHFLQNGMSAKTKVDVLGEIFKNNIDPIKNHAKVDLIFLIDASSSVGQGNFFSEIKFVRKLLSDFTVAFDHARVAIITYSSRGDVVRNVDEISSPKKENDKCVLLNKDLKEISYKGGGTFTLGAFQMAKEIIDQSRNDSQKVIFLVTDGFSNGGDPVPLANELKNQQVLIFTIGIRNGNYKELFEIASHPGQYYSFLLDSFVEFESLARRALHVDLQIGEYIPLIGGGGKCNSLCPDDGDPASESTPSSPSSCCDDNAICTCGIYTGQYNCLCKPGYYGSGLRNSCLPCPQGTYSDGLNLCLPCPDINHVTKVEPALNISYCECKTGYRSKGNFRCETMTCPNLSPPQHGYFVKRECGHVVHSACGVHCDVGYSLTGSSIRLCQPNGTWSGIEPTCTVKLCITLPVPDHGMMTCFNEDLYIKYNNSMAKMPVDTECTFMCENGYSLVGSTMRTCLPVSRWDGLKVTCKPVKCPKLAEVAYGKVLPDDCTKWKQPFGQNCSYVCQEGFLLKGPPFKICTGERYNQWGDKNNPTTCEDVTPPRLECPANVTGFTLKGKNYGHINWTLPVVTDNSGTNITVWTNPSIDDVPTYKFKIGKSRIVYYALDAFKNKAKCDFYVEILDGEPPTIENCEDPPIYLVNSDKTLNVTWDEPIIHDNSRRVHVKKSRDFGYFPMGSTLVNYTAVDGFNNTNYCTVNITLEESHCEAFPDPPNGRSTCSIIPEGMRCVVTCDEGYSFALYQRTDKEDAAATKQIDTTTAMASSVLLCNNDEPSWYSANDTAVFSDCTAIQLPAEIHQNATLDVEVDEDVCNDTRKLDELKNEIALDFRKELKSDCPDCELTANYTAVCESQQKTVEEEATNRLRRQVAEKNAKKVKRVRFKFKIGAKTKNATKTKPTEILRQQHLKRKTGIHLDEPILKCSQGFILKRNICVRCPTGTFHSLDRNACQSCPIGYYNDREGQLNCRKCPLNFSTMRIHSKSSKDCKAKCPPGTHARKKSTRRARPRKAHWGQPTHENHTSLMPFCVSCDLGFYQPAYGEVQCLACRPGWTTLARGAIAGDQCSENLAEICQGPRGARLCNGGRCLLINEYQYTCECPYNFLGSHCETKFNSCLSTPCLNNGSCSISNSISGPDYFCTCKDGFSGPNCESINLNCHLNKCKNNGTCIRNGKDEECHCPASYAGEFCQEKVERCSEGLCENGGVCSEYENTYRCSCRDGFMGRRCTILPCDYKPCKGNAICINELDHNVTRLSYSCVCPLGFEGVDCLQEINYCEQVGDEDAVCRNGADCLKKEGGYECRCKPPFSGQNCQLRLRSDYVLHFARSGITDFILIDGPEEDFYEATVCLWVKTNDTSNYGTIISYATYDQDNAFTLTDYSGLVLYVNGQHIVTDLQLNDGHWHFLCTTWESHNGAYKIYKNSEMLAAGSGLSPGVPIKGYGKFVIGQDQDVLGGKFSQSEAFVGHITQLDVWDKALDADTIHSYMHTCREYYGDMLAWPQFQNYIQGDVKVVDSTFCQACPQPPAVLHAQTIIFNNSVLYTCDNGYQLVYKNKYVRQYQRFCAKSSVWEGQEEPRCVPVYCDHPGFLAHGDVKGTSFNFGDIVIYECEEGYKMKGSQIRQCTESSTWSGEQPSCHGERCPTFPKPANSHISLVEDAALDQQQAEVLENATSFAVGTQVEFVCFGGAQLIGEEVLTCQPNGEWDAAVPQCRRWLQCTASSLPRPPQNAHLLEEVPQEAAFDPADTVSYGCRQGYEKAAESGDNFVECIEDGSWSELKMLCKLVKCPRPPRIEHVKQTGIIPLANYHFGNVIRLECDDGYTFEGTNDAIRCQADGKWSQMTGRCARISCGEPVVPRGADVKGGGHLFGDVLQVTCPPESRNEHMALLCAADGHWTHLTTC